jgi:hypothetical protein
LGKNIIQFIEYISFKGEADVVDEEPLGGEEVMRLDAETSASV